MALKVIVDRAVLVGSQEAEGFADVLPDSEGDIVEFLVSVLGHMSGWFGFKLLKLPDQVQIKNATTSDFFLAAFLLE